MDLLIVLFIAGIAGYYLSKSRYSKNIDATTAKVATKSEDLVDQTKGWWRKRFGKEKGKNAFICWATGPGSAYFPEDLLTWWRGLSTDEADHFTRALSSYAEGLGFELDELVSGKMDSRPALLQVFVEAIVVYSHEYSITRQAQAEAKQAELVTSAEAAPSNGKSVAEKQASHRKGSTGDSAQASTTA